VHVALDQCHQDGEGERVGAVSARHRVLGSEYQVSDDLQGAGARTLIATEISG
jgi:hypothetical protein